jgi:hypothetical protein
MSAKSLGWIRIADNQTLLSEPSWRAAVAPPSGSHRYAEPSRHCGTTSHVDAPERCRKNDQHSSRQVPMVHPFRLGSRGLVSPRTCLTKRALPCVGWKRSVAAIVGVPTSKGSRCSLGWRHGRIHAAGTVLEVVEAYGRSPLSLAIRHRSRAHGGRAGRSMIVIDDKRVDAMKTSPSTGNGRRTAARVAARDPCLLVDPSP